jgi:hypothetical protein
MKNREWEQPTSSYPVIAWNVDVGEGGVHKVAGRQWMCVSGGIKAEEEGEEG